MAATPASVIVNRLRAKQDTAAKDFVKAVLHVLQDVELMAEIATIGDCGSYVSIPIEQLTDHIPLTCTVTADDFQAQCTLNSDKLTAAIKTLGFKSFGFDDDELLLGIVVE